MDPSLDSWLAETPNARKRAEKAASSVHPLIIQVMRDLEPIATGTKQFSKFFFHLLRPLQHSPIILEPVSASTYCPLSSFEISYT
jgi:hypothetical protein